MKFYNMHLHFNQSGIIKQQGIQSLRKKTHLFYPVYIYYGSNRYPWLTSDEALITIIVTIATCITVYEYVFIHLKTWYLVLESELHSSLQYS